MPPSTLRPLISHARSTRFLLSRRKKNLLDQWPNHECTSRVRRFSVRLPSHPSPLRSPLSLRPRLLLPPLPLHSLLQSRSSPLLFPSLSSMTTPQAAGDSSQASQTKTVRLVIKGRVQGVFYRNWTVENATQLGLKGWVRNKRDGSVEALFSGSPDVVQEMEQRCRRGPPDAMVTGLQVFPSSDDPGTAFQQKPTV
ncbi:hypothetical protein SLE2022_077730 [Rubroshorea leprosula]